MRSGCIAKVLVQYEQSEQYFLEAEKEAEDLSADEKLFSWQELAYLYEQLGQYSESENAYKHALDTGDLCRDFAAFLDNQGRTEEANEVRRLHPPSADKNKEGLEWMKSVLQPAVRKHWKPFSFQSESATVKFHLRSKTSPPVAYVSESSGNAIVDRACLKAIEALSISPPDGQTPFVNFSFDLNTYRRPGELRSAGGALPPAQMLRMQKLYMQKRGACAWQEKNLGNDHPQVARSLNGAAEILTTIGKKKAAEDAYRVASDIWIKHKIKSKDSCDTFKGLGDLLLQGKKPEEAEQAFQQAYDVAQVIYPGDPEQLIHCRTALDKVQDELNKKTVTPAGKSGDVVRRDGD